MRARGFTVRRLHLQPTSHERPVFPRRMATHKRKRRLRFTSTFAMLEIAANLRECLGERNSMFAPFPKTGHPLRELTLQEKSSFPRKAEENSPIARELVLRRLGVRSSYVADFSIAFLDSFYVLCLDTSRAALLSSRRPMVFPP